MVFSTLRKIFSFAISLLAVVISLTTVAQAAPPTFLTRYTPGFAGSPGKMVRDVAGNFYVADFWGKGIVKLDRLGNKAGFIPTTGRPAAVAVLADNRLVVAMTIPQVKVAFYDQSGSAPSVTGEEKAVFGTNPSFPKPVYRPAGITVDAAGFIYLLDAGDAATSSPNNVGTVRVYSSAGALLYAFGTRTSSNLPPDSTATGDGQFKQPMGIAYEKQSHRIVVVDTQNSRLQFFNEWNGVGCATNPGTAIGVTLNETPVLGQMVSLGDPTDVAFEYNGLNLNRAYITERSRNEIVVVDLLSGSPTYSYELSRISGATLPAASMKYPSGIVFEKTATGGVLYATNAATSTQANVIALGIDGGTVPVPTGGAMTMDPVPAVAPGNPITVSGTTSPATAVSCSVNGVNGTVTGTGSWSSNLTLVSNSMNYILCQSTTSGVTTYKEAYTYSGTPGTAPVIAITDPTAGLYTKNSSVVVKGTSNTANTTIQLVNGGFNTSTLTDANNNWSALVTLTEGSNLITANGTKPGAAPSSPVSRTVVADFTPPNMTGTISFLNNGSTTNNAVQNLDGIVLDANLASVEVNGVAVPASARVTLAGDNTYFSTPVTLVRGLNSVTIKATDLAGNSTTITRTPITLNPEIPGMTIDLPADNSYLTSAGAVTASGTANAAFNSVNAAGAIVTPSFGLWTTPSMTVNNGFGSYQFTASGPSATTVTEKRTIITDASYAQVAITSPASDLATNASSVVISGTVPAGPTIPKISIDGAAAVDVTTYTPASGAFSHTVPLSAEKTYSVKIIASGTTAVRNIIHDTTLPELTIMADSKPMPVTITGVIEGSAKISAITASLNSSPVTIPLSVIGFSPYDQASDSVVWTASLSGYTYDAISFTTVDPAGNPKLLPYTASIPTGDIDGDGTVRLSDALAALRHVAGTQPLTAPQIIIGDVGALVSGRAGRDGQVDITDAVLILNKSYGLISF